jgi:diacylglycerol diphosphate phosphatase/phosphatidate phosphatase
MNLSKVKQLLVLHYQQWVLIILLVIIWFLVSIIPPVERFYFPNDQSINYPHTENERVPVWSLFLIAGIFPAVIILLVSLLVKRSPLEFHQALVAFIISIMLTLIITDALKVSVGALRPDFLARCVPLSNNPNSQCSGDAKLIKGGRKSWPSGHSSSAFAGLGFLSFYLAGSLRIFSPRSSPLKYLLFILPLTGASLVATSRIADYRHHAFDAITGSLLGIIITYFVYHLYFESIKNGNLLLVESPQVQPHELVEVHTEK